MKKILLMGIMLLAIVSCDSGELTKSKAKKIINKCLEINPEQKSIPVMIGESLISVGSVDSKNKIENYKKLADEGYLKVTLTDKKNNIWKETQYYSVELTEKAKPYLYKPSKMTETLAFLKTYQYVVDEILEIHEVPAVNTAEVKVQYKLADITPFATLNIGNPKETITKTLKFTKTNDGWKYCDNH